MTALPAMHRPRTGLSRLLHVCAQMPAVQSRKVLALVCVEGGKAGQRAKDRALADSHWKLRQPVIAEFKALLARQFAKAKREVLANVKRARQLAKPVTSHQSPVTAAEGLGASILFDAAQWLHGLLAEVRAEHEHVLDTAGAQLFGEIGRDDVWTMPSPKADG